MSSSITGLSAIFLYLLSCTLLVWRLTNPSAGICKRGHALIPGLLAVLCHGLLLYPEILTTAGLNLGFFHAAALIALLTASLLLAASLFEPVENLGIVVFPVAATSIGLLLAYPESHIITNATAGRALNVHILLSLVAYSILGLAALQALLLAVQDRQLHNRHPGGFVRALPPLQTMETLLFQMIGFGFFLLTLALVTGAIFLEDIFAQHLVHKTVLSVLAWGVFAILLWGRWQFGWRSRVAIRWTVGGFLFLLLAYFGSKLVLELILNR